MVSPRTGDRKKDSRGNSRVASRNGKFFGKDLKLLLFLILMTIKHSLLSFSLSRNYDIEKTTGLFGHTCIIPSIRKAFTPPRSFLVFICFTWKAFTFNYPKLSVKSGIVTRKRLGIYPTGPTCCESKGKCNCGSLHILGSVWRFYMGDIR